MAIYNSYQLSINGLNKYEIWLSYVTYIWRHPRLCIKSFILSCSWTYFLYGVHSKHFTTKMSLTFWSSMLVSLNCFILMSSLYTQKVYLRKFNSHFNTRRRSKRDFCQAIENVTNKSNNSSLSKSVCDKKRQKVFL